MDLSGSINVKHSFSFGSMLLYRINGSPEMFQTLALKCFLRRFTEIVQAGR